MKKKLLQEKDMRTKLESPVGDHWLIEYLDCDAENLMTAAPLEKIMLKVAKEAKATILNFDFHQFEPYGVSGYIFIAESHFSIHTWPEFGLAAVDIFTCGKEMNIEVALKNLQKELDAKKVLYKKIERGY